MFIYLHIFIHHIYLSTRDYAYFIRNKEYVISHCKIIKYIDLTSTHFSKLFFKEFILVVNYQTYQFMMHVLSPFDSKDICKLAAIS